MRKKKFMKQKYMLSAILVVSSIAVALIGVVIKYIVAPESGLLKDIPVIAVPFTVLNDPDVLQDDSLADEWGDVSEGIPSATPSTEPEWNLTPTPSIDPSTVPSMEPNADPSVTPSIDPNADPSITPTIDVTPTPTEVPVKEFHAVTESYFDDALFIGDSRTCDLANYARLGSADYFATVGLNVFALFKEEASDKNFSKTTLEKLLKEKSYGKIYFMLGFNEIGYSRDKLQAQIQSVLEQIRSLQPDATLFLMANLHVTEPESKRLDYQSLDNLLALDEYFATLENGTDIFYLDVNPLFCDEQGYLLPEYTGDGAHMYAKHYKTWAEFLLENGI